MISLMLYNCWTKKSVNKLLKYSSRIMFNINLSRYCCPFEVINIEDTDKNMQILLSSFSFRLKDDDVCCKKSTKNVT